MKQTQKYELKDSFLRILRLLAILVFLAVIAIVGFVFIEGMSTLDALYITVISLTTVGYETVKPISSAGKVFTCIYLLFSVVIFLYLANEFAKRVISFNIKEILTKRHMDSRIKNIKKDLDIVRCLSSINKDRCIINQKGSFLQRRNK